jgi:hypothetical protein
MWMTRGAIQDSHHEECRITGIAVVDALDCGYGDDPRGFGRNDEWVRDRDVAADSAAIRRGGPREGRLRPAGQRPRFAPHCEARALHRAKVVIGCRAVGMDLGSRIEPWRGQSPGAPHED